MLQTIVRILQMIRFSHTLFALPFALLAATMAWVANADRASGPAWRWRELLGILLCMVSARSFAMAVNRLADRRLDAANPRTRQRHLPAGTLSVHSVSWFAAAQAVLFLAATSLFWPNPWPVLLAPAVLAWLAGYSFAKRFTPLSHLWLGTALGAAPPAAWLAIRGPIVWQHPADLLPALVLGAAVVFWVTGFDIIYACQDADFDRRAGLRSVPARFGVSAALRVAAFCHIATVLLLVLLPMVSTQLGPVFLFGVALVGVLLVVEHRLVRADDLQRVNIAFFQVNAVISLGLFAVGALDLMLGRGG